MFQAFEKVLNQHKNQFVILDTAPTGHTLLLLDQTGAYHKDLMRIASAGAAAGACAPGTCAPGDCAPAPAPAPADAAACAPGTCAPGACGPAPPSNSAPGACAPGECAPGACGPPSSSPKAADGPTPLQILRDPSKTKIMLVTLPETTPVSEAAALQGDLRRAGIEPYGWVVNSALCATGTRDPLLQQRVREELTQVERVRGGLAARMAVVPFALETPPALPQIVWSGPRPATAPVSTTAELMARYIVQNPVAVFTLANCPFCDRACKALDGVGARCVCLCRAGASFGHF